MMTKKKMILLALLCSLFTHVDSFGQVVAVKTNLIANAMGSPNVSLEVKLGTSLTLDLCGHYYPFYSKESLYRWRHWLFQPELRFWSCEPFSSHFFGIHFLTGEYNIAHKNLPFGLYPGTHSSRYEGAVLGGGLSYGYQWILSPRWGIEAELGAGYVHVGYERYRCVHCGERTGKGHKIYLGPTKAAISVVYLLK
ncbi:MAG: DUF3575 domain-containing protein [Bacteroides sp.]|jgi:hypothetical protein|nr:DUF3575 domain-containing protein [Bacteroides sp.]